MTAAFTHSASKFPCSSPHAPTQKGTNTPRQQHYTYIASSMSSLVAHTLSNTHVQQSIMAPKHHSLPAQQFQALLTLFSKSFSCFPDCPPDRPMRLTAQSTYAQIETIMLKCENGDASMPSGVPQEHGCVQWSIDSRNFAIHHPIAHPIAQ